MDCSINLSKYKDIADNIIKVEDDCYNRILKLHYKNDPSGRCIMNIIKYLNCTDWKNFKFNEYSIKKDTDNYIVIFSYVAPKAVFSK